MELFGGETGKALGDQAAGVHEILYKVPGGAFKPAADGKDVVGGVELTHHGGAELVVYSGLAQKGDALPDGGQVQAGDAHGLPYLQMMENAGMAAYAELQKQLPHPGRLLVVCGKGNNGGDGFVIARAAAKDGWNVTVFLAEGEPKTADAILNFERLHSLPVHICTDGSVLETQSFAAVVDALYGTGFHGELRPSGLAACGLMRRLHKSGAFVLAVDLPSGINTDTGEVAEGAAHADLTVTFDSYKPLHIAEASAPLCGKIVCADIGIRDEWHPEF